MSKIDSAVREILRMDVLASKDTWLVGFHPLIKVLVTIIYIVFTVSFSQFQLEKLLLMILYPAVLFILGEVSFREGIRRLRIILPLVCLIGIFNPIFDRREVFIFSGFVVTSGMISMITLMIKGVLCVFASYLLIATTRIEKICYGLRQIHMPAVLVTQILLTYRYISLLLSEAGKTWQAYSLRAPEQKGIHIKAWGSLLGGLLLRSMDRASALYESMTLRGYHGEFDYSNTIKMNWKDMGYLTIWCLIFVMIKFI